MEALGKKLQQARLAKKLTLDEASRVTKIRAARIQEIEAEDFSSFSSLAYAKGFLLIYGKFLDVDVTPYLDAFETSNQVSVDGYAYLQEAPLGPASPIVRRQPAKRPALLPFIIAVGVLVLGLYLVKLMLNIQRITPSTVAGRFRHAPTFRIAPRHDCRAACAAGGGGSVADRSARDGRADAYPGSRRGDSGGTGSASGRAGASGGFGAASGDFCNTAQQPCADHAGAQNLPARDGRQRRRGQPSTAGWIHPIRRSPSLDSG